MLYCELSFFDGQQRCHGCITACQALAQAQQDRLRQHLTDEATTTPDLAAPPLPTVSRFAERLHDLHARLNDAQERTTSDMHQIIADLAHLRAEMRAAKAEASAAARAEFDRLDRESAATSTSLHAWLLRTQATDLRRQFTEAQRPAAPAAHEPPIAISTTAQRQVATHPGGP